MIPTFSEIFRSRLFKVLGQITDLFRNAGKGILVGLVGRRSGLRCMPESKGFQS